MAMSSAQAAVQSFVHVLAAEHVAINERRGRLDRENLVELGEAPERADDDKSPRMCGPGVFDTVGLALSGGGIRSAAFCLGALQALDATAARQSGSSGETSASVLDHVDYLSTVSGGGYIGASMVVGMSANGGSFPFVSKLDQNEPFAVQHIRNYSNYLLPRGVPDAFVALAIYLRGIVANVILILPVLLVVAAATIFLNAHLAGESRSYFSASIIDFYGLRHFVVTAFLATLFAAGVAVWALTMRRTTASDLARSSTKVLAVGIVVLLISAFCELQPIVLSALIDSVQRGPIGAQWDESIKALSGLLASAAAIISFLGGKIGNIIERGSTTATRRAWLAGLMGRAMVWIAAAALPVVLWICYIGLSFWGLPAPYATRFGGFFGPAWLENAAAMLPPTRYGIALLYLIVAVVVFAAGILLLSPNANSLHRLYRDRLGKKFLFNPFADADERSDPSPLDATKLSDIVTDNAPYPLINTALNIQGSRFANRRGRNAEFFLFSPRHVGSEATGYVKTEAMEDVETSLDVGTAMAVSGAAVSSNMGSASVRPLTPTLALLNVRLGFWMLNPRHAGGRKPYTNFFLLNETFGLLNETRKQIYLTDGGHIENLGIYQLLKRHCGLIIAVDGEADPAMNFNSFVKLQRYARIDLGVRIELPWQGIREATLAAGASVAKSGWGGEQRGTVGPHCALGRILYPKGGEGILLYTKASLTGDENDYVIDYKRRHPAFPHETTSDQFFSEEQFEVYRALGFHALKGFLDKKAVASISMPAAPSEPPAPAARPPRPSKRAARPKVAPPGESAEVPSSVAGAENPAVQATQQILGISDEPRAAAKP
jgi:hypothetical protein